MTTDPRACELANKLGIIAWTPHNNLTDECREVLREAAALLSAGAETVGETQELAVRNSFEQWSLDNRKTMPSENRQPLFSRDRWEAYQAGAAWVYSLWNKDCGEANTLLQAIGLNPDDFRTDGGILRIDKIAEMIAAAATEPQREDGVGAALRFLENATPPTAQERKAVAYLVHTPPNDEHDYYVFTNWSDADSYAVESHEKGGEGTVHDLIFVSPRTDPVNIGGEKA